MTILVRLLQCAIAALVVLAPTPAATAARSSEVVPAADWLQWLRGQSRSFDHRTANTALAVRLHADSPSPVDLHGIVNADGSMAVSFTTGDSSFDVRCIGVDRCWVRQTEGVSDRLWHRISTNEMAGLRRSLPEVDGLLGPGVTCAIDRSRGRLDYEADGTVISAVVSFADGGFSLDEHLAVPADGVSLTVTKSLSPTRPVGVRAPRASVVGPPLIQDVVPELP